MSRKGRKAFDNCSVAQISPIRRVKRLSDNVSIDLEKLGSGETYKHLGYHARLHCAKLEDIGEKGLRTDDYLHMYQSDAVASLRDTASEILCGTCEYSGMNSVEVLNLRTQKARAEAERLLAFKALEAARGEIQRLSGDSL